jgi:hypothetical protein
MVDLFQVVPLVVLQAVVSLLVELQEVVLLLVVLPLVVLQEVDLLLDLALTFLLYIKAIPDSQVVQTPLLLMVEDIQLLLLQVETHQHQTLSQV